ncbi:MAG: hypothetical protein QW114_00875 [Candidatus Nezhaarchaeales archaeon]
MSKGLLMVSLHVKWSLLKILKYKRMNWKQRGFEAKAWKMLK